MRRPRLMPAVPAPSIAAFGRHLRATARQERVRIRLAAWVFLAVFGIIAGQARSISACVRSAPQSVKRAAADAVAAARPDILDRNGEILATDVKVMSVFAEPRRIIDKDEAVELLTAVLPDVDARELRERLGSRKGFVWVKRAITPKQQQEVYRLGLPGVGFLPENKRVYPNGPVAAHVLGFANLDGIGISGLEKYIDGQGLADLHGAGFSLTPDDPEARSRHRSISRRPMRCATSLPRASPSSRPRPAPRRLSTSNTGEIVAMASLPDYDPNTPVDALDPNHINRLSVGVYEMGSTFKAISVAMALDSGKVNLHSRIDARDSLRYGRFTIHDFHATAPRLERAGGLHLFVQYRRGAHGSDGRRRGSQGLLEKNGPADPSAHGTAGDPRSRSSRATGANSIR